MTGASPGDDAARRTEEALKDLRKLVKNGISGTRLEDRHELIRRTARLARQLPGEASSKVLDALLRRIVENERATRETPNTYLRAAGEFIGLCDENVPDPSPKDYEVSGGTFSPYRMRILRGGRHLGITTYTNAREHVEEALKELLAVIHRFVATDLEVNRFVAEFRQSRIESGVASPEPINDDQRPADVSGQDDTRSEFVPQRQIEHGPPLSCGVYTVHYVNNQVSFWSLVTDRLRSVWNKQKR